MKSTASPTVLRFLTSSSGIFTSNFSSALTTMVIIEIESMSRSSVKDLSSATASGAMPVSSLMSSESPARISSLLNAILFSLVVVTCTSLVSQGALRQFYDLRAVDKSGAEADLQCQTARKFRMFFEQCVHGERDGSRGRVALHLDIASNYDRIGELQLL